MNTEQAESFLKELMGPIGLGNFTLVINKHKRVDPEKEAQIFVNPFGKEVTIDLYGDFYRSDENRQRRILIHELIHGRVRLKEFKIDNYTEDIKHNEEEYMVNDIVELSSYLLRKEINE